MQPQISICRKQGNLYLKLRGNFIRSDSKEILEAVQRLVDISLEISSPNIQVFFTFQTHAQIGAPKAIAEPAPESDFFEGSDSPRRTRAPVGRGGTSGPGLVGRR